MGLALLGLSACAAKRLSQMSMDPVQIQTERIQRIAVFPFESPPDDPPAGMHISKLFEMYLLQSGLYRIAERGDLDRQMKEKGLSAKGALDLRTAQEWGKALQVDGMVFGMVSQYNRFNLGFTARLVSAKSGLILWSVSQTGGNILRPLSQVADETVRAAVEELKRKIR
jgi:TolB-like protein